MTIYSRQITTGAAFREGRAPSHDGEYITLYIAEDGSDWFLAGNGGPLEIDGISDLQATVADGEQVQNTLYPGEEDWRIDAANEARHIMEEIALAEADPEGTCEVVTDPAEAMSPACQNIARVMGWNE